MVHNQLIEIKLRIIALVEERTSNPLVLEIVQKNAERFVEVNQANELFLDPVDVDQAARDSLREDAENFRNHRELFVRSIPWWKQVLFCWQWRREVEAYDEFIRTSEHLQKGF